MAWELSTKVMGLPAERVWVSVFEDDDEAFALWRDKVECDDIIQHDIKAVPQLTFLHESPQVVQNLG